MHLKTFLRTGIAWILDEVTLFNVGVAMASVFLIVAGIKLVP